MNEMISEIPEWLLSDDNRVSLYSSVRIVRNFKAVNYPQQTDVNSLKQVEKTVGEILGDLINAGSVSMVDIAKADRDSIIRFQKFRLLPKKRNDLLARMKLYRLNKTDSYLLTNYYDHLTFFAHSGGKDINGAYNSCSEFLNLFDKEKFSRDKNGNYLTSSLDYFGTGLKCFSVLTIPSIKLFGEPESVISDLKVNGIACTGYFSADVKDLVIVSSKDSISRSSEETVKHFNGILNEFDRLCRDLTKLNIGQIETLKQKTHRIFNYEFLTFRDFIEIYNILSFVAGAGLQKTSVPELNRLLAELIETLSGKEMSAGISKALAVRLKEITDKIFK